MTTAPRASRGRRRAATIVRGSKRRALTSRLRGDRGAAAVLVLTSAVLLALLGATATALAAVAVARQRAAAVADLAALAAAQHALEGPSIACGWAARIAAADAARLTLCELRGDTAAVMVQVTPPGPLGRLGSATGRARAGPAPVRPDGNTWGLASVEVVPVARALARLTRA